MATDDFSYCHSYERYLGGDGAMTEADTQPIIIKADNYFAAIPYWILELGLSSEAVHLYAVLIRFSNWTSHQGYPSRKRLADCMKVSIKAVDRAKDELVKAGVLDYERRHNKSNYYTVITSKPSSVDSVPSDKNDISRGDKNDTLTRVNNNNKAISGSLTPKLVALYLDNLPSDVQIKPKAAQVGKQIKDLLSEIPAELLERLIPLVAESGKPLSTGTLRFAESQFSKPEAKPTYTPPPFRAEEAPKGVKPPENIRILAGLKSTP